MKTTVKQLATGTFIALILLAGNVNAKGTKAKASNQEIETTLQVEKWMINESVWNPKSIAIYEIGQESETGLELENWMTSAETWNLTGNFIEEAETNMELESWMTSEEIWNTENKSQETDLTIENWMISEKVWNR